MTWLKPFIILSGLVLSASALAWLVGFSPSIAGAIAVVLLSSWLAPMFSCPRWATHVVAMHRFFGAPRWMASGFIWLVSAVAFLSFCWFSLSGASFLDCGDRGEAPNNSFQRTRVKRYWLAPLGSAQPARR